MGFDMKMRMMIFVVAAMFVSAASGKDWVWDGTKGGGVMSATEDTVLFRGADLSGCRLAGCWFNKAGRRRANGTPAMCNGQGTVAQVRRDGDALEAQCQVFDDGWTKCVKIRLRQRGEDIVGRVLYGRYCTRRGADRVGEDFDTLTPVADQPVYAVLPSGIATDGYNVDWLMLRGIGASEDNLPELTEGTMPDDDVLMWMERAVDPAVWRAYRAAHPAPFHLFGEDRRLAVRNNILPAHWLAKGSQAAERFYGVAQPGEFYPFQVCVVSETARTFRWRTETGLQVTAITPPCASVPAKGVKPIWVMVTIPKDSAGMTLTGNVVVSDEADGESRSLPFAIEVKGTVLEDGGVSDAWRLARLKWLESHIGQEETVTRPYLPVAVDVASRTVRILGRELVLGADGLPAQILSHFNGSNTRLTDEGVPLLAYPFSFTVDGNGTIPSEPGAFVFTETAPTHAAWRAVSRCGTVKRIVEGRIDYAGVGFFRVRLEGKPAGRVALEVRMRPEIARFMEGLGRNGGWFNEGTVIQRWDRALNRDAVWMGRVNGGIAIRLKGANYRRPLINAYYAWRTLLLPESWAAGEGTITVEKNRDVARLRGEGGPAPEGAEWNFDLFVTPFHPLDMKTHLAERYFHIGQRGQRFDAPAVRRAGATVVNLHHNTVWNPYINYPYNDDGGPLLKQAVREAHDEGLLLKVYYTTRELTQNLPEFFALKSLDGEVFLRRDPTVPGWPCTNGNGPHPWLREHVGTGILPAWRESVRFGQAYPPRLDLAVITTPDTRWDNFYLEGLDHLVRMYGIDGIYIDDTALTGEAMQRARRILDRDGKRRLVDNHSWNHHHPLAGSGSTNLAFLDLYPYFDLLWRGEGFSNDTPPDFWLMERSGIPFGIPGEMLGRGNPFRGLLFGMTDRWGWGGDPLALWRFFDETGLGDAELVGWWDDACPVKTPADSPVKASLWKGKTCAVLVIANFSKAPATVTLSVDAAGLGFDGAARKWTLPAIGTIQKAGLAPDLSGPVSLPGAGGLVLTAR